MTPRLYKTLQKGPYKPAMAGHGDDAGRLLGYSRTIFLARAVAGVMIKHFEKSWGSCALCNITYEHNNGLHGAIQAAHSHERPDLCWWSWQPKPSQNPHRRQLLSPMQRWPQQENDVP